MRRSGSSDSGASSSSSSTIPSFCSMAQAQMAEDGASWDTVLRFLETPTPADYSFEFSSARVEEVSAQTFEENLVVDEYLFKQPQIVARQQIVYNRSCLGNAMTAVQELEADHEWKLEGAATGRSEVADSELEDLKAQGKRPMISVENSGSRKSEGKKAMIVPESPPAKASANPGNSSTKFLKLTEAEMVQSLRRWKSLRQRTSLNPVVILEADVYALHPADLVSDTCTHYFYSLTKYSCLKRPTRLRITENGCRWKQQGRIFPIRENGVVVAFKTYLSYVALKGGNNNNNNPAKKKCNGARELDYAAAATAAGAAAVENDNIFSRKKDRRWSTWTMEEVGLAEDIEHERVVLKRGGRPRPFPVICRIVCKRDDNERQPPSHTAAKLKSKKTAAATASAVKRAPRTVTHELDVLDDYDPTTYRITDSDLDEMQLQPLSQPSSSGSQHHCSFPIQPVHMHSMASAIATTSSSSDTQDLDQDAVDDEIIRALIYDLPYGKVRGGHSRMV